MLRDLGSLLDELKGLQWPARRPIRGGIAGVHHSRLRGTAPELAEYRLYRQGDEARRIDWKLLARSDRAYIRLAPDRATLRTLIVVDASASMAFPGRGVSKWELSRRLTLGLAAVAHAGGDPVGVVVPTGAGLRTFAPRSRRGVLSAIAGILETIAPVGSPSLMAALDVAAAVPRVAVITDFLGESEALLKWTRTRSVSSAITALVHVVALDELEPGAEPMTASDPEAEGILRPFDDRVRESYTMAYAAWRDDIARGAREAGADYRLVTTGESAARAVRRIVTTTSVAA